MDKLEHVVLKKPLREAVNLAGSRPKPCVRPNTCLAVKVSQCRLRDLKEEKPSLMLQTLWSADPDRFKHTSTIVHTLNLNQLRQSHIKYENIYIMPC